MQIYLVGGAVRDALLGLPIRDRDWVVVGATPQQLVAQGFVPVGRDFPVFLHPRSKEQYALARTERKTAPGYRGFAVHAAADVTLEQDLARRDLTINAIAVAAELVPPEGGFDPAATLTDPYWGQRDLLTGVLRHVSQAFREDPVRILRVARFAARFSSFVVASETMDLMREMVAEGEVEALVAERVWQELARGLMERAPARMFDVLHACGALSILLPELAWGSDANAAGASPARALGIAARGGLALQVRFACLFLHLAPSPRDPPERTGAAIRKLCQRLRVPAECLELAEVASREVHAVHASTRLDAAGLVHLLERCDAFRRPQRFDEILQVCECDALAATSLPGAAYLQRGQLLAVLAAAQAVATDLVASRAYAAGLRGKQLGEKVQAERIAAVHSALTARAA